MRRVTLWIVSTVAALVLLFSYSTSTGGAGGAGGGLGAGAAPARVIVSAAPSAAVTTPTPAPISPAPQASTLASTTSAPAPAAPTPASSAKPSGIFTGGSVQTRWGPVQVQVTVTAGTITDVQAIVYPDGNGRDQEINAYALPVLRDEVLSAQGTQIDTVSGATVTSDGYISSLQSALDAAHLGG